MQGPLDQAVRAQSLSVEAIVEELTHRSLTNPIRRTSEGNTLVLTPQFQQLISASTGHNFNRKSTIGARVLF